MAPPGRKRQDPQKCPRVGQNAADVGRGWKWPVGAALKEQVPLLGKWSPEGHLSSGCRTAHAGVQQKKQNKSCARLASRFAEDHQQFLVAGMTHKTAVHSRGDHEGPAHHPVTASFPGWVPGQDSCAPSVYHPHAPTFDTTARRCQPCLGVAELSRKTPVRGESGLCREKHPRGLEWLAAGIIPEVVSGPVSPYLSPFHSLPKILPPMPSVRLEDMGRMKICCLQGARGLLAWGQDHGPIKGR